MARGSAPGRVASGKRTGSAAGTGMRLASHDTVDFSIYNALSEVFYDLDRDGYFYGFAMTFDADVSSRLGRGLRRVVPEQERRSLESLLHYPRIQHS